MKEEKTEIRNDSRKVGRKYEIRMERMKVEITEVMQEGKKESLIYRIKVGRTEKKYEGKQKCRKDTRKVERKE